MKTIILVLLLSLTSFASVNAQMRHESNQKETEEKIVYHTVALGETVVLIAKSYKIRPQDIYEYNEGAAQGISSGMSLRIPLHRQVEMVNHVTKENDNYDLLKKSVTKPAAANIQKNESTGEGTVTEQALPEAKEMVVAEVKEPVKEAAATEAVTEVKEVTHQVVSGENLYRLSLKYNTTVEAITAANKKKLKNGLQVGQVLTIPSGAAPAEETPKTEQGKTVEHKVMAGETLTGIAKKYNTTIDAISKDNASILKRGLQAGQVIKIVNHTY